MILATHVTGREAVTSAHRCVVLRGLHPEGSLRGKVAGHITRNGIRERAGLHLDALFGVTELRNHRQISVRTNRPTVIERLIHADGHTDRHLEQRRRVSVVIKGLRTVNLRVIRARIGILEAHDFELPVSRRDTACQH